MKRFKEFYVQVIRNGFLSLLALGVLTLEGHAQKTQSVVLECEFPLASNDDWNMAASTVQYSIDTSTGWKVSDGSFSFEGPTNLIVGGKEQAASLSITISRQSGKASKILSSEGKFLKISGECKKAEAAERKF